MSYTPFSERILPENDSTKSRQNDIKQSDKDKAKTRRRIEIIHEQIALEKEYMLPDHQGDNDVDQSK
ncbi:hypothetical protein MACH09_45640 [Vibrio sp. MACH09]|uniref:hypothetical protein n=1 Tax=Vibrio sp. MACH09 TaxID=3025122 RepID=UPI00279111A8|nr:hypothetical protein [Vibrio sp. MACH09]GLO64056.1 hypothetical protein MACH09_45640 [Vibrio sp. MACH09]